MQLHTDKHTDKQTMNEKEINKHLAWCAAWNKAIFQGLKPIEALRLAQAAEAKASQ